MKYVTHIITTDDKNFVVNSQERRGKLTKNHIRKLRKMNKLIHILCIVIPQHNLLDQDH